ncbi:MAG: ABC transporter ATP-binding protein [Paracoccaceae bacterium]|nr:ABC transporter ATP-binding protein [Paracoccaceae bacterium]
MTQEHLRRAAPRYAEKTKNDKGFLEVMDISKFYKMPSLFKTRYVKSVNSISLKVQSGEVMGLVGESGSGKSTFAKLITRQVEPTQGAIWIDGKDWLAHKGEDLRQRRRDVQMIFQDPFSALDPRMKLGTSMGAPLAYHGVSDAIERMRRVHAMLNEVGLDPSFADRLPRECSGGQLQRVVVGRALLLEPKLLICDEPTSALDASMKTQILNLFLDLKTRRGISMIMISHDLRLVRHICDRIAVMYLGRLIEIAETEHLFEHPCHPYTQALMASSQLEVTGLDGAGQLTGELPSPIDSPTGCGFHPRCSSARPDCSKLAPMLKLCQDDHYARCRYWDALAQPGSHKTEYTAAPHSVVD